MQDRIPELQSPRIKELYDLQILDTAKEVRFDRYVKLIGNIFNVPIVLISLMDVNRQWFKACFGTNITENSRELSFCNYIMDSKGIVVIPDTVKDPFFSKHALVIAPPHVRFYAGVVLKGPTDQPVGTLCLLDIKPREFNENDYDRLNQFGNLVEHELHYNYYLNEMRKKIENSLYYDPLTSLPNQRLFEERLDQAIMFRESANEILVFSIRIERFHDLQDAFGQLATETIIKEVSDRLQNVFHIKNTLTYLGSGHFTFFIKELSSISAIRHLQSFLTSFRKPFQFANRDHHITCRIGLSVCPKDSTDHKELLQKASIAMNLQQINTELPYQSYSTELSQKLQDTFELEHLLRKAIKEDKLDVFYQPKVDLLSGRICGAEALCRWTDSERGSILPLEFISIAENSDLIVELGDLILRKICLQNIKWHEQGFPKIRISVNVSGKQLLKKNYVEKFKSILSETKCDPSYLDLEITESALIEDFELAVKNIEAINEIGVTFSLDDFGTGYSSLAYLRCIRINNLKIDKSFIENIEWSKKDAALVQGIIATCKSMHYTTVAEGVESINQLAAIKRFGCDQIQGYLFSPPLLAEDFSKMVLEDQRL